MKKKILAVVLSSMMALGLAACGGGASSATKSTASSKADVSSAAVSEKTDASSAASAGQEVPTGVEDGVLTVGFDAEYPPYGYMDENGGYTGFDLETAEKICEMEGWKLEKKPINWDAKDMELNSGAIDCIWNGFTRNGRENDYTFSASYVDNSQVVVVSKDSGIGKLSDLAGKKVGVQAASAALTVLETSEDKGGRKELAETFGGISQFADYNTAFTELKAGALDALAIDVAVAKYQIKSRGEGFMILDETLNSEEYAVGFRKGNTALADIITADMLKLAKDGWLVELAGKYEIADMLVEFKDSTAE